MTTGSTSTRNTPTIGCLLLHCTGPFRPYTKPTLEAQRLTTGSLGQAHLSRTKPNARCVAYQVANRLSFDLALAHLGTAANPASSVILNAQFMLVSPRVYGSSFSDIWPRWTYSQHRLLGKVNDATLGYIY